MGCDFPDLYELSFDERRRLDGFCDKKARKLHSAMESAERARLEATAEFEELLAAGRDPVLSH